MIGFVHWINGAAILGVAGVAVLGQAPEADKARTVAATFDAGQASRFMVVDHANEKTCVVALHRSEGYDIHRLEPGDCAEMPADLAAARTWQDTPSGDVQITDHSGKTLMKLGASDGFAWEVVEPREVALSFEAY